MSSITKARAERCLTHHDACDCKTYRMQQMEQALKIIRVWASEQHVLWAINHEGDLSVFLKIADKCKEALSDPDRI